VVRAPRLTGVLAWGWLLAFGLVTEGSAQDFHLLDSRLEDRTQAALALLSFSVTPDASAGSLSINSSSTGNPDVSLGQVGAGFTVADSFPLYMEGFVGYSRYDPVFVASDGTEQKKLPTKWNSVSGTAGLGWDFKLSEHWVLRPIVNVSLGHLESDLSITGRVISRVSGSDVDFLDKGRMNTYGLGASLMLDYGISKATYEWDVELRYTWLHLQTFDTSKLVAGETDPMTVSLWTRYRWPSGFIVFRRPLRWVLEGSASDYVGDQRGALGFNLLSTAGGGIEMDTSQYSTIWTRTRFVVRYLFGRNVSGASAGISITFF
jgi:autotransporter-like protein